MVAGCQSKINSSLGADAFKWRPSASNNFIGITQKEKSSNLYHFQHLIVEQWRGIQRPLGLRKGQVVSFREMCAFAYMLCNMEPHNYAKYGLEIGRELNDIRETRTISKCQ